MNLTHIELVHHNNHYNCVVSVEGLISNSLPITNDEVEKILCNVVTWFKHFLSAIILLPYCFLLVSLFRCSFFVLGVFGDYGRSLVDFILFALLVCIYIRYIHLKVLSYTLLFCAHPEPMES